MQAELQAEDQPIGPRRLNFAGQSPDDFELLAFWIVGMNFPDVVRVSDPDAGADAALRRRGGGWERCWQAKRFAGQIKWHQCTKSLDDAVKHYDGLSHYTFCFARDLTAKEEAAFTRHLVGRHTGVTVDYWGKSRLELMLISSPQGDRIALQLFGEPTANAQALMDAVRYSLRAGGALETGADVVARLSAVVGHLATRDPLYSYLNLGAETEQQLPSPTPPTVMSMHTVDGESQIRIDAVPRNVNMLTELPAATVHMPMDLVEEFERFLRRGGEFKLEGVKVEMRHMPALFQQMSQTLQDEFTVLLSAPRTLPKRWHGRFRVLDGEIDAPHFDVLLEPTANVDPPWEVGLVGTSGGLTVRMLFRSDDSGGGSMNLTWSWQDDATRTSAIRAPELRFIEALSGRGRLVIDDLNGERDRVSFDLDSQPLHPYLPALRSFLEDLAVIEEQAGRGVTIDGVVPVDEVRAVATIANMIRNGEVQMNFEHVVVNVPPENVPAESPNGHQLMVEQDAGVEVLGVPLMVGRLRAVIEKVNLHVGEQDHDGNIGVRFTPATEEAKHPIFKFRPYTEDERRERGLLSR